jgi:hypothetical protein
MIHGPYLPDMSDVTLGNGKSAAETGLARLDRALGVILSAMGLLFLGAWWTGRAADRHGLIFVFLGALVIGPIGALLWLAGLGMRRGWRLRWALQALSLVYPILLYTVIEQWFA